jgi:hypothetical protein
MYRLYAMAFFFLLAAFCVASIGCGGGSVAADDPAYEGAVFPNTHAASAEVAE